MRRVSLACVVTAVLVVALASCGGSGAGSGTMSDAARAQLEPMVADVRRAAESVDRDGAARALAAVRQTAAQLHARHAIDDDRTRVILTAAARVEAQLPLVPATTTSTTTSTSTSTTTTTTSVPPAATVHVPREPEPTVDDRGPGREPGKGTRTNEPKADEPKKEDPKNDFGNVGQDGAGGQ